MNGVSVVAVFVTDDALAGSTVEVVGAAEIMVMDEVRVDKAVVEDAIDSDELEAGSEEVDSSLDSRQSCFLFSTVTVDGGKVREEKETGAHS